MKILFFSAAAEITGQTAMDISAPVNIEALKQLLEIKFPDFKKVKYAVAVNKSIVSNDSFSLNEGDEIAILPPFSGG